MLIFLSEFWIKPQNTTHPGYEIEMKLFIISLSHDLPGTQKIFIRYKG